MSTQLLTIIGSLLAIIIGIWKYFGGKRAEKRKKTKEAQDETEQGVDAHDTSRITDGFDRINRL